MTTFAERLQSWLGLAVEEEAEPDARATSGAVGDPHQPRSFAEFIGQEEAIRLLRLETEAAKHEGRPLAHLLFYGPPGVGKCLASETLIASQQQGWRRIADYDTGKDGFTSWGVGRGKGAKLSIATPKEQWKRISHIFRDRVETTIRLTTHLGFSVQGTPEHPLLTPNGWKCLADFHPGEAVLIQAMPFREKRQHLTIPTVEGGGLAETLDGDVARLLGYLIADGWCAKLNRCSFTNSNPEVQDDFERVTYWSTTRRVTWQATGDKAPQGRFSNKTVGRWLESCGLVPAKAPQKTVPTLILQSPKAVIREFLRAYLECETHFGDSGIEIVSASTNLARQIHLLLLSFGIVGRLSPKHVEGYGDYWRIMITGRDNFLRFSEELCPVSSEQRAALAWRLLHSLQPQNFRPSAFNGVDIVTDIRVISEPTTVFDFTVPDGHCFLSGGFVSHNTALAFVLAAEMGGLPVYESTGAEFVSQKEMVAAIARVGELQSRTGRPAIFLLDEVDGMARTASYPLHSFFTHGYFQWEGRRYQDTCGGPTIIATTNHMARVHRALKSRFHEVILIDYYSPKELAEVARHTALRMGFRLTDEAAKFIGENAAGEPRKVVRRILRSIANLLPTEGTGVT